MTFDNLESHLYQHFIIDSYTECGGVAVVEW